ncbi:MAG: hypothetical protein HOF68_00195 [Nitrospina sp.]|nr:hypothetical protein [Nitrospina sp.]
MRYFFNMQCPDCGYICFKQAKACGGCGFDFKKAKTSTKSLFRNDSFRIFAGSEIIEKEQESSAVTPPANSEEIAVMDPPGDSLVNPEQDSEEFLLNLSDAEEESPETDFKPSTSESDVLEFSSHADINLEEMEVEGLGLGLEPLEEEPAAPETEEPAIIDLAANDSSDPSVEIAIEEEPAVEGVLNSLSEEEPSLPETEEPVIIDLAADDSSDPSVEIAIEDEPAVEVVLNSLPEENDEIQITDSSEVSEDTGIEVVEEDQVEIESTSPVLDLGEEEISLEIDEDFETGSPAEPPPLPVQIEELDLNLEIDDSDGPLSTTNIEIPEIEIEDLGLELEDSDSPPPDSEKP